MFFWGKSGTGQEDPDDIVDGNFISAWLNISHWFAASA
jgi:hypothetical protein